MIKIQGLTHKYILQDGTKVTALKDINLEIEPGEQVALIGSSGAGKSTLLRCINRLLEPMSGKVLIEGKDIICAQKKEIRQIRRKIGMIFQQYNLIQRSLAIDNVLLGRLAYLPFHRKYLYGLAFTSEDYEIALDSLAQVKLRELAFRRVDNLSGGQQQRVGIARVLAQQPKIILADEPVSNLDPKNKKEILSLISSLCQKKGITLLISMHEVELVKKYVNRVIGIKKGCIIFDGSVEELTGSEYEEIYR